MKKVVSYFFICLLFLCFLPISIQAEDTDEIETYCLPDYTEMYGLESDSNSSQSASESLPSSSRAETTYQYIAVFIEFPDDDIHDLDSEETVNNAEIFFNDTSGDYTVQDNAGSLPLLSFKSYIEKYSYGKVSVDTSIYPHNKAGKVISYVAPHNRSYYMSYSSSNPDGYKTSYESYGYSSVLEMRNREFELVSGAVEYVEDELEADGLTGADLDVNNDGMVDAISFFVEIGTDSTSYNTLLWSHKLMGASDYISSLLGDKVDSYNIIKTTDSNDNAYGGTFSFNHPSFGTVVHEFMHILGLPDLYRYNFQSTYPVGFFDVLATNNKVIPQPTLTYNLTSDVYGLNWHDDLTEITESTDNIVITKPEYTDSSEQNAIIIKVPGNEDEFFVAEYYDVPVSSAISKASDPGIILYRINTNYLNSSSKDGNAQATGSTTTGFTGDATYVFRPGDSVPNAAASSIKLKQAVLNLDNPTYGIAYTDDTFDNESIYYEDGTNSGLVVQVTDQDSNSVTISVDYNEIKGVSLNETELNIVKGNSESLSATVEKDGNVDSSLTWSSSDESIATVDQNGNVNAVSSGTATITATAINGMKAECIVNVKLENLEGYSLTLSDSIGIHFYMALADEIVEDESSVLKLNVPNSDSYDTKEYSIADASIENGYYVFTCYVSAKEMTQDITAQIQTSTESYTEYDFSVADYGNYILNNSEKYDSQVSKITQALLTYGSCAQTYFQYHTDVLPIDFISDMEDIPSNYSYSILSQGETKFVGARLILESTTGCKLYFTEDGNYCVDGEPVETENEGKYTVVKLDGVKPTEIGQMHTITCGDFEMKYGILSYGIIAQKGHNDALIQLMHSLYAYYQSVIVEENAEDIVEEEDSTLEEETISSEPEIVESNEESVNYEEIYAIVEESELSLDDFNSEEFIQTWNEMREDAYEGEDNDLVKAIHLIFQYLDAHEIDEYYFLEENCSFVDGLFPSIMKENPVAE